MLRGLSAIAATLLALAAAWGAARAAAVLGAAPEPRCLPHLPSRLQPPPGAAFPDAPADTPRGAAAAWLRQTGVLHGDPTGRLQAERPLTWAEALALAARAARAAPGPDTAAPPGAPPWAAPGYLAARARGWVTAAPPPGQVITWDEAVDLLLAMTDNRALAADGNRWAAARRLGWQDAWRAAGVAAAPQQAVRRGDFAVALLTAMLAPRGYDPAADRFRQPVGLLAELHPATFRAFAAQHPGDACR